MSERRKTGWRLSVRARLLALALLPMLVVLPVVLGFALVWWLARLDSLLLTKANDDLIIARQYLRTIMGQNSSQLSALGQSAMFADATLVPGAMETLLDRRRKELGLDFLYLVNREGKIVAAAPMASAPSGTVESKVIASALQGKAETSIDIFEREEMERLSSEMANKARIELVPTRASATTEKTVETCGLVIQSAVPVVLTDNPHLRQTPSVGHVHTHQLMQAGALVGGALLNGNLGIVDTINEMIYSNFELLGAPGQGTATLFLDDVRIATNVRLFEDHRALGTRVSKEVRDAVLGEGRTWLDRAFVVNDRYFSAYEPIIDSAGRRVGMLGVSFLEKPFLTARRKLIAAELAAFVIAAGLMLPFLLLLARAIFRPLEAMNRTIAAVDAGDLGARTGGATGDDEIGLVARRFDGLLDSLQARDAELRAWTRELDARVERRTRQLDETRRQLVMSEKLASIGEITAGIAHEINNPIAVIQGNLEVARETLGPSAAAVKTELDLIDQQVHRVNMIVTHLLQFARPDEYAGYVETVVPGGVLANCLVLVRHLLERADIEVAKEDRATRSIEVSPTELQQVLINLMVNAIHAMPEGGKLNLLARDDVRGGVEGVAFEVSDTGVGIPPEQVKKIFDPFFTTRTHGGTGLGLSISYTLMARYGGAISVESEVGRGSTFTIWLPVARGAGEIEKSAPPTQV